MEVWKSIKKFDDQYEVSNKGRVRSKAAIIIRSNGRPHTRVSKVLKPGTTERGYCKGYYGGSVCVNKKMTTYKVHRLVAEAFCEGFSEGLEVNHIDGNKLNNNADNLEWVTRSENVKHAVRLGLLPVTRGSQRTQSTVTEEQVRLIKDLMKQGFRRKLICESIGCSIHVYKDIQRGKSWKHV